MKLDYTYHSHTKRCGHAIGADDEYALTAYQQGFKVYGFSDHVILPDRIQKGMRGDPSLLSDYVTSIRRLQKEYEGKMDIYLGFEAEWYHDLYRQYYADLLEDKIDYLILGQHCYLENDRFCWYGKIPDKQKATERYVDDLLDGMSSGLYLYVAHPDLFMSWYPVFDDFARGVAERICEAAIRYHLPLEVNMGPSHWPHTFKEGRIPPYPCDGFWDVVSSHPEIQVVLGVDDHMPYALIDTPFDYYLDFVKRHHLNVVTRLEITKKS